MRGRTALVLVGLALTGCGEGGGDPAVARGRQVYLAQCTACHASDPGQPGAIGPAVSGSTRALLEAKILKGSYPPGYTPKRPSTVMPPMPQLGPNIDDLVAFLR